jgi:hypothetical protein
MDAGVRQKVLERLYDLEGWAQYVLEALHVDQSLETVTPEMIQHALEPQMLRELREQSWSLWKLLHRVTTEMELSLSAKEAASQTPSGNLHLLAPSPGAGSLGGRCERGELCLDPRVLSTELSGESVENTAGSR